ncbi:MAG TPA: SDR family NAD(P)-dependent oxidoreductase [Vicinamibacterales bacterium]|nr:SDR family NAD(P)-dependent oxidoreductase [Vicinamibacterales bacterium]
MAQKGLFDLSSKVVAVIGSGSGIGEAVAAGCAQHGARVACFDVNAEAVERVCGRIASSGAQAEWAPLDIRESAAVDDALDGLRHRAGRVDGVVCTPSINVRKTLLSYTEEEFDRVVTLNLKGNFNVLRSAGRIMTAQKSGSIVLFSSIRSQVVEPGQAVYAATKAGILQMARTAAAEFGPYGVRVNAVGPGVIETPLTAPIKNNPGWYQAYAAKSVFSRWGRVEEVVGPVLLLLSDAGSYITGTLSVVDGGWLAADGRFMPPGM